MDPQACPKREVELHFTASPLSPLLHPKGSFKHRHGFVLAFVSLGARGIEAAETLGLQSENACMLSDVSSTSDVYFRQYT